MAHSTGSDRLRQLFRDGVVTQARLAAIIGIKQQAVSAWARGEARPTLENMLEIERLYSVPCSAWAEIPPKEAVADATPTFLDPAPATGTDGVR